MRDEMSSGVFIFTPKPLVLDVTIQDPKAEGGRPFRYPDWDIDELHYQYPIGEMYEGMFDTIKDALPKYCSEFSSNRFTYLSGWKKEKPTKYKESIRALTRLAAFIRMNVGEMGELWYVKQWIETLPERPEDIHIIEMNIDDLEYVGDDVDSFKFQVDTFYRFMNI